MVQFGGRDTSFLIWAYPLMDVLERSIIGQGGDNMKRLMNASIVYGVLGLIVGGVFYREFTKLNGFTGFTTLSVVHTHYLILGISMILVLISIRNCIKDSF